MGDSSKFSLKYMFVFIQMYEVRNSSISTDRFIFK